ncbi:MAG: hypothetical protein M1827_002179 [Pycnora praestabilis]|nr:MAG: hypothetical protein M1827_002179 [Pycnora praestabilis]
MAAKERDNLWVVQKYGGTSLGKLLKDITGNIIPDSLRHGRVAIVCSARSGTSKSKGTTSLLLEAVTLTSSPGVVSRKRLDEIIDIIRDEHLEALRNVLVGHDGQDRRTLGQGIETEIHDDCEQLRNFLHAAQTVGELSSRAQDRVIALGEKLACRIVVSSLTSNGIAAQVVLLENLVEQAYASSSQEPKIAYDKLGSRFFHPLSEEIGRRVDACHEKVPVIMGFFGMMPYSLLESVGRGYSDLCAAMCAVGIGARELQIWKEVDGIFTADPSQVPSARLLPTVTSEEAMELTYFGSEVIHPLTMEHMQSANIPIRLKNVSNPAGSGTIIYPSVSPSPSPQASTPTLQPVVGGNSGVMTPTSTFMISNGYYGESQGRRVPTAITAKHSIVVINVLSNHNIQSHGFLARLFTIMDQHNIVVDLITTSKKFISLAVGQAVDPKAFKRATEEIGHFGTVSITEDMSIISVVGHKMRNMVGVAGDTNASP